MSVVETTASSGAILGIVAVLLLQQLGVLPLSDFWTGLLAFVVAIAVGAGIFGAVGWSVDRR